MNILSLMGFDLWTSGVGSDHSANRATTSLAASKLNYGLSLLQFVCFSSEK